MKELLRRCPSCGRRFVVRIKSKRLVNAERDTERFVHNITVGGLGGVPRMSAPVVATTVDEIPIERETFDISYECRHCDHKWTETVTVVERA